jgi:hypothetical protein
MLINSCPPIFSNIRSVITSIGNSSSLNKTVSIGAVLTGGAGGSAAATEAVVISAGVNGVGFISLPQYEFSLYVVVEEFVLSVVVVSVVVVVVEVDVVVSEVVGVDVVGVEVVGVEVVAGFNGSCGV